MAFDYIADLSEFMDETDGFGEAATLIDKDKAITTISVIFDPENLYVDPETGATENAGPIAWAKSADVEDAKHKDILEIDGTEYEIKGIKPDGSGLTALILGKT